MRKIISFIVLLTFLFSNSADALRIPLNSPELKEHLKETQRQLFLEKYGLLRFLAPQEASDYLATVDEIIFIHTGKPMAKKRAQELIEEGTASIAEKEDGTKVVTIISPIEARFESDKKVVTGITYMKDGESTVTVLNPAPEFDFTLIKRIRDRLAEDEAGNIVSKEEDLYSQVMEVKGFLGLYGKEASIPELIDIVKDMRDPRGIPALLALELKGAMFSAITELPKSFDLLEEASGNTSGLGEPIRGYNMLMLALLYEGYIIDIKKASEVARELIKYYEPHGGFDSDTRQKERELREILNVLTSFKNVTKQTTMQTTMKASLRRVMGLYNTPEDTIYVKIALWLTSITGYRADISVILKQLKSQRVVLRYKVDYDDPHLLRGAEDVIVDFRRDLMLRHRYGMVERWSYFHHVDDSHEDSYSTYKISEEIPELALKRLGINVKPISENGIAYLQGNNDLITSRVGVSIFGLGESKTDIGRSLRSLAKNVSTDKIGLKRAIVKKLTKLQQKRPEAIPIIREKAFELLELDEENFREALEPFVGDYIAIRDAIRYPGVDILDGTATFYNLFDEIVNKIKPERKSLVSHMTFGPYNVIRAVETKERYGDFDIIYVPHETRSFFSIQPLTNLSNLETTHVLFLDTEVSANPYGFKEALQQLRQNKGNIPVILLTQETEQSVRDKLKDISLEGVRFRTLAQLGLQNFNLDEAMSLIAGIDDIKVIPLSDALTDAYEVLKKARDQV